MSQPANLLATPRCPSSAAVLSRLNFEPGIATLPPRVAQLLGFRFGERGTHTSRTMMLTELSQLLASAPPEASRDEYARAAVEENCLGKRTAANRRSSLQRLAELYALDGSRPLFRILRDLWRQHESSRPLLALLLALARDPLLRATAGPVLAHAPGNELARRTMERALAEVVGDRLGAKTLDKAVRNAASSWTQSGHVRGRSLKIRQTVEATPAAAAYALLLGHLTGQRGRLLLETPWTAVLDAPASTLIDLAADAKRLGLIDFKHSGSMIQVSFPALLRDVGTGRT